MRVCRAAASIGATRYDGDPDMLATCERFFFEVQHVPLFRRRLEAVVARHEHAACARDAIELLEARGRSIERHKEHDVARHLEMIASSLDDDDESNGDDFAVARAVCFRGARRRVGRARLGERARNAAQGAFVFS